MNCKVIFVSALCLSYLLGSNFALGDNTALVKSLSFKIVAERTHKTSLFTQGLEVHDGHFIESSGLYNKSYWAIYPIEEPASTWSRLTAPFSKKIELDAHYFAEGLTEWNHKVYLLTWKENQLLVYSVDDFRFLSSHFFNGEGWGLTHDSQFLIRSDGTDTLYFHQPTNFKLEKTVKVTLNDHPVEKLNELEYLNGFIYANLWRDQRIIKIDASNGKVVGVADFSVLVDRLGITNSDSVLNGIAYDDQRKGFWITGKNWPKMFLIIFE